MVGLVICVLALSFTLGYVLSERKAVQVGAVLASRSRAGCDARALTRLLSLPALAGKLSLDGNSSTHRIVSSSSSPAVALRHCEQCRHSHNLTLGAVDNQFPSFLWINGEFQASLFANNRGANQQSHILLATANESGCMCTDVPCDSKLVLAVERVAQLKTGAARTLAPQSLCSSVK